jgi:hypothetical protein
MRMRSQDKLDANAVLPALLRVSGTLAQFRKI